ncbi:putative Dynamin superfamily, P-loop containing nucleoside triphosphate hydrolase [Helianthus annuus]|nr:putative Dynamin superfamily, P-loop containing nucleoside triphosphate hydrolase [Helianthus annuus]KAJ0470456.1 putative Dynamin superfamily, P-loop containing nucleoside triphosphate hydrolase [Helianthus annuus]KAJ0487184.1 putative Dynamin superfamily, P-loop containing nucleoside triphosphate hydrolase [Helianthus annuus]
MKFDMGGSAAVLGAAKAVGQIKPSGVELWYGRRFKMKQTESRGSLNKYLQFQSISSSIPPTVFVSLTLIDLPGLTKVAVEGQLESIVEDIEKMVRTYVEKVRRFAILCLFDSSWCLHKEEYEFRKYVSSRLVFVHN